MAAISIGGIGSTIENANFAKYASEISSLQENVTNAYGSEYQKRILKGESVSEEEIYKYLAGGTEVTVPQIIREQGATKAFEIINAEKLSSGTELPSYRDIKFYIADNGMVYTQPGYEYKDKMYLTAEIQDLEPNGKSGTQITLKDSRGMTLTDYKIYGNSVQNGEPKPSSPVAIESLGEDGTIEVVSSGKNLIDADTVLVENGFAKQGDGSFYVQNNNITYEKILFINEGNNDVITISFDYKYLSAELIGGAFPHIWYSDGTKKGVNGSAGITTEFAHTIFTSDTKKIVDRVVWTYGTGSNSTWIKNIQIEQGPIATSYEPYKETRTVIDMTGHEPLRKIGDASDYIDYKNGRIVRNIGKVDLGTLNWNKYVGAGYNNFFYCEYASGSNGIQLTTATNALCSNYKIVRRNDVYYTAGIVSGIATESNAFYVYDSSKVGLTKEEFKSAMSGVYVYYQLAESPTEPEYITLPSIPTYKGTTVLTVGDGNLSASNVEVEYFSED